MAETTNWSQISECPFSLPYYNSWVLADLIAVHTDTFFSAFFATRWSSVSKATEKWVEVIIATSGCSLKTDGHLYLILSPFPTGWEIVEAGLIERHMLRTVVTLPVLGCPCWTAGEKEKKLSNLVPELRLLCYCRLPGTVLAYELCQDRP